MSINNLNTYLNIKDSHLRVVSGNVYAQAMNIGGINVETAHGLQSVSNTGNVTSNTIQFSNAITSLTAASNVVVTGNVTAGSFLGDGSGLTGINLQAVTDTGNVTSNTVQFSNPTTAFKATSNIELTSASKIIVESNVLMDFKTLGQIEFPGSTVEQEYPPGPMSSNETLVEGHGAFVTHGGSSSSAYAPWRAFNKELGSAGNFWIDTGIGYSDVAPYGALSTHSKTTLYDGSVLSGGWIDLICPYPIKLSAVSIAPRTNYWQISLQRGIILGSNNGEDWYQIDTIDYNSPSGSTGTTAISNQLTNFGLTSTSYYSHIRLVCTHLTSRYPASGTSDMHWQMGELVYFGTPGPTTLDKGSLTLGRSLDVPRISRYDVDTETPRPEKLVVDFDTTVNSSPTDISGNGNHGVLNDSSGAPTYSPADKAFDFDGVNGVIYVPLLSPAMTGDRICSMSCWFKTDDASQVNQTLMWLGAYSVSGLLAVMVSNGSIGISIGSTTKLTVSGVIESNKWYHVVGIKTAAGAISTSNFSSTFKLYLNGELTTTGTFGGVTRTLNVTTNYWYIGAGGVTGQEPFSGYISNPKLYDTVLEPSEVQKLYRLGRTGRSMVISDTAVGIGKAPEAQLDVRGNLRVDGDILASVPYYAARQRDVNLGSDGARAIIYDAYVYTNYPGSFVRNSNTDGYYQPPRNGMYQVYMECIASSSGNVNIQRRTGTTVDITHCDRHWNFTGTSWESVSASALIPITDFTTQNIRIYVTAGYVWSFSTFHGSAYFKWFSEIPERRQHHVT